MKHIKKVFLGLMVLVSILALAGCKNKDLQEFQKSDKFKVVATTTMLGDLVKQITGQNAKVHTIIGEGTDPHTYEVTGSDRKYFDAADAIVISGLHLEAHMGKALKDYKTKVISAEDALRADETIWNNIKTNHKWTDEDDLKAAQEEGINELFDPHFWFNVDYWKQVTKHVGTKLQELDKVNTKKDFYTENVNKHVNDLDEAKQYAQNKAQELTKEQRVLFTAHDAFNYFAEAFDFTVLGVQGISTEGQASQQDIDNMVQKVIDLKVHVVFPETSTPDNNLKAVIQSAKAKKHEIKLADKELCSDSLDSEIGAGTYIKMIKYNIDTIVNSIKESLK